MAIDVRADVTCSLGPIISGSVGDDYIQGNGLVKVTGEVEVNGLITPAVGTPVTFSYTKEGTTRNIPRKLRVLSSFADPFRRTTKVELGCKLTYLEDLREPIDWTSLDDPENSDYTEDDARVITVPIYASSVMNKCLEKLDITASSNPLTNRFSIAEFDFSSGYVNVLNDLLISESCFAYLDEDELLQVVSLNQGSNVGPVYTLAEIADLGAINSGSLPGESVVVSYDTLKLKVSSESGGGTSNAARSRLWEYNKTEAGPNYYYIGGKSWSGVEVTETETTYEYIGESDLPVRRVTSEYASSAKIVGSIGTSYVKEGIPLNIDYRILRKEVEVPEYEKDGTLVRTVVDTYEDRVAVFGSLSLDYVFVDGNQDKSWVSFDYGLIKTGQVVTEYKSFEDSQQQTTTEYKLWPFTIPGQQAVAEYRDSLDAAALVSNFVAKVMETGLVHSRTTSSINIVKSTPGRPKNLLNAAFSKDGNPSNGWRQESDSELQLALGSATAQRRIEFSMPYASDDVFIGPPGGPYTALPSDASEKATTYGRVQNRLLLGNRSGMSLQLAPERIPSAPFSPIHVQANGLTAFYRANGNQWAFSSTGIVCSTDALFWAAVGGTGDFWFPVAPNVTTLPETPPIIDGQMDPDAVIPPYNETVVCKSIVKTKVNIESFAYSFTPVVVTIDLSLKLDLDLSSAIPAEVATFSAQGKDAQFIFNRSVNALSGSFLISPEEADFIPRVMSLNAGVFNFSGSSSTDLIATSGIVSGNALPVLGATLAADISEDTTGWIEHTTNDDWWNGSSYVDPGEAAYLHFSSGTYGGYFSSMAGSGLTAFPNDCFIGNHPYMTFNGISQFWDDAMFLNEGWPPLIKVFFGAEQDAGIEVEKMNRRVLYREEFLRQDENGFSRPAVRIRYEGIREISGTPGTPDIVAEITFVQRNVFAGDDWIEVRIGTTDRPSGMLMLANEDTAFVSPAIATNSSWVFAKSVNSSTWTVYAAYHLV